MPAEDKDLAIRCRREFVRRQGLDCTFVEVNAVRGVVSLRGELRPVRGQDVDLHHELDIVMQNLRRVPGVRDVRSEVEIRYGIGGASRRGREAEIPEDFE